MKSRRPNRLPEFDYSHDGCYFFTSVVQDRLCCLGEVRNGITHRNQYGEIAQERWFWLAEQYPYVRLHAFVVMPNHVHGILEINRSLIPFPVGTGRDLSLQEMDEKCDLSLQEMDEKCDLSLQEMDEKCDLSLPPRMDEKRDLSLPPRMDEKCDLSLPPRMDEKRDLSQHSGTDAETPAPIKIKSLSELKGAYKTTVSKHIHLAGMPEFAWQRSFQDHIIRDAEEFDRISAYIRTNPARWAVDRNH